MDQPNQQQRSKTRSAYITTYLLPSGKWRVYEALLLDHPHAGNPIATIVFVDETGGIRVVRERHYLSRNSAVSWVYADEFEMLAADVERDWQARRCGREQYEDVQRLRQRATLKDSPRVDVVNKPPTKLLTSPIHSTGHHTGHFKVHDEAGKTWLVVDTCGNLSLLHDLIRAWSTPTLEPSAFEARTRTWEVRFWLRDPLDHRKLGYPRLSCRVEAENGVHAVSRVRHCYGRIELDEVELVEERSADHCAVAP